MTRRLPRTRGGFKVVVADPPWPYKDRLPGGGRGAAKHYSLMTVDDIGGLRVERIVADDAVLFLWAPNAFVASAWCVAVWWGFTPKTLVTWVKSKNVQLAGNALLVTEDPRIQVGMGRSLRNCTEQCILATRGKVQFAERNRLNVIFAPRTEHSRKPDELYEIVEANLEMPYVELFARRPRRGWRAWGDLEG